MSLFTYSNNVDYVRDKGILAGYYEQCAEYVARKTGADPKFVQDFIETNMQPGGLAPLHDPKVTFLHRQNNGDRAKREDTFINYLNHVYDHDLIMAPTMTVYLNRNHRPSQIADFIKGRMDARSELKHQMFVAKQKGEDEKSAYFKDLQATCKIDNNSVSGAHASAFNILFNKTSHSSLTSSCRISTSYANANGEWFLGGNRHFWCPQVVIISLLIAIKYTDFDALQEAMVRHKIHEPSNEDVYECIRRSSGNYWRGRDAFKDIEELVETMSPLEKAAFVYTGDLYHLAKHNPDLVRSFLTDLAQAGNMVSVDAATSLKKIDSDVMNLVTLLNADRLNRRNVDDLAESDPEAFALVGGSAERVLMVLDEYSLLIRGLWRPKMLPPSIAVIPSIIRRVVCTSDTDSTIFTNQYWTRWICGEDAMFSKDAYNTAYATTYLNSQLVKHKLAVMSANLGAIPEHVFLIQMKNEYFFPAYALTPVAKHYFAFRSAQEGHILKSLETEIKGVHLRDSSLPSEITKQAKSYMENIMSNLQLKGKMTVDEVLAPIANLENDIRANITAGGYKYMKSSQVKSLKSYPKGEDTNVYKHYLFWNQVFAPKYGLAPQPPYQAIRVSVDLDNKKAVKRWLESMEDKALAHRIKEYMAGGGRTEFSEFILPLDNINVTGMPKEIIDVIDIRKLTMKMSSPFYLALESVGIRLKNKNLTRMVSDTYTPLPKAA